METDRVLSEVALAFRPSAGGRQNVPKMLIVLTDDAWNRAESLKLAADPLLKAGVRVHVVGIGSRVDSDDWKGVVPDAGGFTTVDKPDDVPSVAVDVGSVIKDAVERSTYRK